MQVSRTAHAGMEAAIANTWGQHLFRWQPVSVISLSDPTRSVACPSYVLMGFRVQGL